MLRKIYADFCRLRDLRDAGKEAPKYTEEQAFDLSINPILRMSEAAGRVPSWERGVATVTMTGRQLREALEFINPDGPADELQADDELTFGVVQHEDDAGNIVVGLCCWNDDTDGVYPLHGEQCTQSVHSQQKT